MAFGSFFTRALDVVTPWNRGGEVQRRQERKKREEQQWAQRTYRNNNPRASVSVASRGPEVSVEGQDEPKPKQPENIFETLNKNLVFNKPQNTVPILSNKDNQPYEPPKPGVVVTPTQQTPRISEVTTAAPQNLRAVNSREVIRPAPGLNTKPIMRPEQTAANRFTDIFDANTEADKFRRANEAQKELVKRGVSPVFAQRAIEQSPDALRRNNFTPSVINFVKDAITSAGRGVRAVTVNPIESGRELVASKTKNKEAEKAAQYRKNVAFYGKETADRLARGEEVSFGDTVNAAFDTLAVLPLAKGASMLESGVRESFTNRTAIPAVKQLLAGLDEAFLGVRDIGRKKPSPDGTTKVKTATPKQANEGSELENLVKNLRENQKAYKGEKKLRKAEFGRRQAQKQKLYEQYRAEGMSGQEAKRAADKALGGQYTKSFASNPEVSEKTVNEILDKTKGDQNTQNAFARWFDPNRSEALRDWERTRIRQYFQKELGEDAAQAVDEAIVMAERAGERSVGGKIADFMTSSIAAGDISAVGRQGLSGLINHPKMSKGAWGDALKALMNSDGEKKFAAELTKNPNVAFIQEHMGGKFLTLSDVADEGRGMDVANKATSWYVNPSNRHYNTYLDSLRLRQKEAIINRYGGQEGFLKAASDANPDNPEKWMKAWNNVIDRQSGRGSFSNFGSPTVGDMQVLFSARNLASKFQRLTAPLQLGLAYRNPAAYIYQLKETAAQAAALGATLAAIKASGIADIENGKIKIGKTRIDITGGFATLIKAADDVRKSMGIGHDTSEDKGFKRSGFTVATDFFQNQLAPTLGSLAKFANVDWGKGEDKFGNKIDAKWWAGVVPMPAVAQTAIQSTLQGENPLEVARNVALDAVGFNTTTYESSADKEAPKTNETKDILKQLKQEGIGVSTEDVDNYVADGDFEKASRVAEYNLKKLQSDPKTGSAEIKKAEKALEDFTVRKEGIPTTDDGITAKVENGDWDTAIKGYELKLKKANQDGELSKKTEKAIQTDMERVRVLRDNGFEPGLFSAYKDTSLPEWLKMGDPESEDYDPETYQKLWEIDQKMTEKKVSNKEGDSEKPKYSAKAAGKGRGGRGGSRGGSSQRAIDTSFGALKDMSFIPKAKEYASIDSQSGSVPIIRKVRPNIVHKITSSG